tara:strand:+ start:11263 stop:11745 length:483 start_codon:yes stop_codon:yes gene_type:complete
MVVKSATKKKLMDIGIPEEVAHVLSDNRRWSPAKEFAGTGSIKELMTVGSQEEVQEFVDIIRPVMHHYPFKNAPVENLMLWYGIIMETIADPTLGRPESPVFYSGVGHVLYLGGGKPPHMMKQRLQDYVKGPTAFNENMFKHAWNPESKHYAAINKKVIV